MRRFRLPFVRQTPPAKKSPEQYSCDSTHIPQNPGTSGRVALERRGDVSLGEPFYPQHIHHVGEFGRHLHYSRMIRSPWSRAASRYVLSRQTARGWASDDPRKRSIEQANFEDFEREQRIFEIPEHPGKLWMGPMNSWLNQLDWITDEDQNVPCDCLRMERLDTDMETYFGEPLKVLRENTTGHRDNDRELYTAPLIEIAGETFHRGIDYFGFTFDEPVTKGIISTAAMSKAL